MEGGERMRTRMEKEGTATEAAMPKTGVSGTRKTACESVNRDLSWAPINGRGLLKGV